MKKWQVRAHCQHFNSCSVSGDFIMPKIARDHVDNNKFQSVFFWCSLYIFPASSYIDSYLELFRAETMNESSVCIRNPSPKYDRGLNVPNSISVRIFRVQAKSMILQLTDDRQRLRHFTIKRNVLNSELGVNIFWGSIWGPGRYHKIA